MPDATDALYSIRRILSVKTCPLRSYMIRSCERATSFQKDRYPLQVGCARNMIVKVLKGLSITIAAMLRKRLDAESVVRIP